MANPTPSDVRVDRLMTNFSLQYALMSGLYLARSVFPTIPVEDQTGLYATYPKGFFLRNEMKIRPLGGEPEYIDHAVAYQNYRTDEYTVGKMIDDRVRANSGDPLGPDRAATIQLTNNALINLEEKFASSFFKTGVWTFEYQGVANAPGAGQFTQFDQAGGDPIGWIQALADSMEGATGYRPNRLTLGVKLYRWMTNAPQFLDRVKYSERGIVTTDLLAALLDIESINVARGIHNTATEGQADNISRIVDDKSFLLAYADTTGTVTTETVTAGAHVAWTNLIPGAGNALGGVIVRGRKSERYSDWMHIRQAMGQIVVAPDLGAFARNVIS